MRTGLPPPSQLAPAWSWKGLLGQGAAQTESGVSINTFRKIGSNKDPCRLWLEDTGRESMGDRSTISAIGVALAGLCLCTPTGASAQAPGTYTYSSGKTTGTMVVTDVSACEQSKALGCMSAARPLKVSIRTLNGASGNDCDLDAIEETAGRISSAAGLQAMLVIQDERSKGKPNLSITFAKGGAVVKPQDEGSVIGCGAGVVYDGRWRRKGR